MWKTETVYPWEVALLYVDGTFRRTLPSGRHRLFRLWRKVAVFRVPSHSHVLLNAAIDVMTSDRFAARLSISAEGRITDARAAVEGQHQHGSRLSAAAFEAAAEVAASHTLESLFADRAGLSDQLTARLAGRIPELALERVAVTQVVVPPEVRRMLTEVERARREGEASLERARAEHASLRSLANAARLFKDNPDLMRLRTLQAVSPTGKGATLVLGQDAFSAPRPQD